MKKRYVVLICLIFLLIPSYIAVSYVLTGSQAPKEIQNVLAVTVISPAGKEYVVEYSEDNNDAVMLYSLFLNKKGVRSIPSKVSKNSYFTISYSSADLGQTEFKGYFTKDPSQFFLEYRNGIRVTYYQVDKESAVRFLDSIYSEGVYSDAKIPTLTIGGTRIEASEADWNYFTYSGNVKKAAEYTLYEGDDVFLGSVDREFTCNFDNAPDSVDVVIKRSDTNGIIYKGDAAGISSIELNDNYDAVFEIKATWNRKDEHGFFGTVEYRCRARLRQPPYFFLSENEIMAGEMVVLSCKNVTDLNTLQFKCEPEINYTPVFFPDGDYYRALIPISLDLGNERELYKFTLTTDETESVLELLVNERSAESKTVYNVTKETLESVGVKSNPYPDLYQKIKQGVESNTDFLTVYTDGKFNYGYPGGVQRATYGDSIRYSKWTNEESFTSFDYFYAGMSKYDPVKAVNRGKVVYVGSHTYTGQLVVIDHGYGLLSWYWNLGSIESGITVGAVVEKGAAIGYNGGGGLTEIISDTYASIHIGMTVFGTPVDLGPLTVEGLLIFNK